MSELANLIGLVVRKELYAWFSSGAMNATVNPEKSRSAWILDHHSRKH